MQTSINNGNGRTLIFKKGGGAGTSASILNVLHGRASMTNDDFVMYMKSVNTKNVTDMAYLLCGCPNLTSIDVTGWDCSSVERINGIFAYCVNLTSIVGGKSQSEVDAGVKALRGLKAPINLADAPLDTPSLCAILNGLGTIEANKYCVNMSVAQYAAVSAYTTVDYIAIAKAKGWLIGKGGYSDTTLADEQAGTIIGKNADGEIIYVKYSDFIKDDFDTTAFTPIAILTIPRSHTYDGKCRGMSLMNMDLTNPEQGSTSAKTMVWGINGQDESLKNYSSATTGNVELGGTLGVTSSPYLPIETGTGTESVIDTLGGIAVTKYGNGVTQCMPSPYGADGIVNTQYRQGSSANTIQCNTDMDGETNTSVMVAVIANSSAAGVLVSGSGAIANNQSNYPPFAATYRYQGGGFDDHSWYVPSCGEFGYATVRWSTIDASLAAIISKYGSSAAARIASGNYHWTSTEYNSNGARVVQPSTGNVANSYKNYYNVVRAFRAF